MCPVECAGLEVRRRALDQNIWMQSGQTLFGVAKVKLVLPHYCSMTTRSHLLSVGVVLFDTSWLCWLN